MSEEQSPLERLFAAVPEPEPKGRKGNGKKGLLRRTSPTGSGDYTTLKAGEWFKHHNHYGRELEPGKHAVLCPWHDQHSDDRGAEASDTVVWDGDGKSWAQLHCLHAHCQGRTIEDVLKLWTDADQFCSEPFQPVKSWRAGGETTGEFQAQVDSLVQRVEAEKNPAAVFEAVELLAQLDTARRSTCKARLKDILGKRLNLNDLEAAITEARRQLAAQELAERRKRDTANGERLPEILIGVSHLRDVSDESVSALVAANNPPTLFVQTDSLARVRLVADGRTIIERMNEPMMCGRLARVADFVIPTKEDVQAITPPADVVRDVLTRGDWPLPALEGVTEIPILRRDGSIVSEPGYDPFARVLYAPPPGFAFPPVRDTPTDADVTTAADLLQEMICDFPFELDAVGADGNPLKVSASRANALAAIITPVVRYAIAGGVPLALFDKPRAGTGAGLLCEVVAHLATGRPAEMTTAPDNEEEWRKSLTSILVSGQSIIIIDNVDRALSSAALASALTANVWISRIVGTARVARVPQRATWLATGNNIQLKGDLPRRSYKIRMNARSARPWMDRKFRHPDLTEWVLERRGDLLAAVLTLARAWHVAGCPGGHGPKVGGFSEWCRVVGGILHHAGIPGFLGNLAELYNEGDEEAIQWEAFLRQVFEHFEGGWFKTADLAAVVHQSAMVRTSLPDDLLEVVEKPPASFLRRLGWALKRRVDTHYGDDQLRLEQRIDSHTKIALWRINRNACGVLVDHGGVLSGESGVPRGVSNGQSTHGSGVCGVSSLDPITHNDSPTLFGDQGGGISEAKEGGGKTPQTPKPRNSGTSANDYEEGTL
ncbi:MAG: hypothetical protein ACK47B_09140 [Armatimonadota bacterium]